MVSPLVRASEGSRTVISFSRSLPRSWKSRIAFSLQWCLIFSRMTHLRVLSELWYLMWNPKVLGLFLSQACEKNKFINNNNYKFKIVRSVASLHRASVVASCSIANNYKPLLASIQDALTCGRQVWFVRPHSWQCILSKRETWYLKRDAGLELSVVTTGEEMLSIIYFFYSRRDFVTTNLTFMIPMTFFLENTEHTTAPLSTLPKKFYLDSLGFFIYISYRK